MDASTDARSGRQDPQNILRHPEVEIGAVLRELEALSPDELLTAVDAVERVSRLVEAAQVKLAGRVAELCDPALGEHSLAAQRGCRNDVELLQRMTRAGVGLIRQRTHLAKRIGPRMSLVGESLPALAPYVAEAVTAGELSLAGAQVITMTLEKVEEAASLDELEIAERVLVETATGGNGTLPVHTDDLRIHCKVWGNRLDQDGPEPVMTCPEEKRWFKLSTRRDGLVSVSGVLLPEPAAVLGRLLDAVNSPRVRRPVRFESADGDAPVEATLGSEGTFRQGSAGGQDSNAEHGEVEGGVCPEQSHASELAGMPGVETRTGGQQRHDALAVALNIIATQPEIPNLGGAPVTVMIQAKQSDLENGTGTAWINGHDGQLEQVPMKSARHGACAGSVQRVIQDDNGRIVELGTRDRIFNAHQRRAITLRDGGCIIPGCTVPGTWCEIHHVQEWANDGPTHTDNGTLICWSHHRNLDTSGWEIRMNLGVPEVRPPDWIDPLRRWYRTGSPLRAPDIARAA